MNMIKVDSSNLEEIGYNSDSLELEIRFKSPNPETPGSLYRYALVPAEVFDLFLNSESKGKFFFQNIKGRFLFVKVPDEQKPEPFKA